jgi:predicted site-specific integrase-resolvase
LAFAINLLSVAVAYCRVSSQAQKPDLVNQRNVISQFCVAKGLANVEYIEEIGGRLNFKRPKFLNLVDRISASEIEVLVLAHKDRLARFGFELLRHLCEQHGCKLLIINDEKLSPEREMVEDLMTIIHCFSSRLYGLRNYKKALKTALASP